MHTLNKKSQGSYTNTGKVNFQGRDNGKDNNRYNIVWLSQKELVSLNLYVSNIIAFKYTK